MHSLFFDLDGTLTDPKLGITRSIQFALDQLNLDVPETDELLWCIGPPLLDSLRHLTHGQDQANQALKLYRERFSDVGLFENHLYPGVADTLEDLKKAGHPLYVATSKPTVYAKRILDHFQIASFFTQTFGSGLDGSRANKSELLAYALNETNSMAKGSIMIGDRSHDMVGAVNNGMFGVGVLYGYGTEDELIAAGARKVVPTVNHLKRTLFERPASF